MTVSLVLLVLLLLVFIIIFFAYLRNLKNDVKHMAEGIITDLIYLCEDGTHGQWKISGNSLLLSGTSFNKDFSEEFPADQYTRVPGRLIIRLDEYDFDTDVPTFSRAHKGEKVQIDFIDRFSKRYVLGVKKV